MSRILKWFPSMGGGSSSNSGGGRGGQADGSDSTAKPPPAAPTPASTLPPSLQYVRNVVAWCRQSIASAEFQTGSSAVLSLLEAETSGGESPLGKQGGGLVQGRRPTHVLWMSTALVQALYGVLDAAFDAASQRQVQLSSFTTLGMSTRSGLSHSPTAVAPPRQWSREHINEALHDIVTMLMELFADPCHNQDDTINNRRMSAASSGGGTTERATFDALRLFHILRQTKHATATSLGSTSKGGAEFAITDVEWSFIVGQFATGVSMGSSTVDEGDTATTTATAQIGCLLLGLYDNAAAGILRCLVAVAFLLPGEGVLSGSHGERCEELFLSVIDRYDAAVLKSFGRWCATRASASLLQKDDSATTVEDEEQRGSSSNHIASLIGRLVRDETLTAESGDPTASSVWAQEADVVCHDEEDGLRRIASTQALIRSPSSHKCVVMLAASWLKRHAMQTLRVLGRSEYALQIVGDCLGGSQGLLSAGLSQRLWCLHAECLRGCGELEAATALAKEAYEGSCIAFKASTSARSHQSILTILRYGREYYAALHAKALLVASTKSQNTGNGRESASGSSGSVNSHHRFRTQCLTVLSECRCYWERAHRLFYHRSGGGASTGGGEELPMDVPNNEHTFLPNHCPASDALRHSLLHWNDYRELMQCRVWLNDAMADALLHSTDAKAPHSSNNSFSSNANPAAGINSNNAASSGSGGSKAMNAQDAATLEASSHIFLDLATWIDGLRHPRWCLSGSVVLSGRSPAWGLIDAFSRRGAALFRRGAAKDVEESVRLWQKALQDVWLIKERNAAPCAALEASTANTAAPKPQPPAGGDCTRAMYRLLVHLCQAHLELAEWEGVVERSKKLMTDALNFAYEAKKVTAPFASLSTTTTAGKPVVLDPNTVVAATTTTAATSTPSNGLGAPVPVMLGSRAAADAIAADTQRTMWLAHCTASYLVCQSLCKLGQHKKAAILIESLLALLERVPACRRVPLPDDKNTSDSNVGRTTDSFEEPRNPALQAIYMEALLIQGLCASRAADATLAFRTCAQIDAEMEGFRVEWQPETLSASHSNNNSSSNMHQLLPRSGGSGIGSGRIGTSHHNIAPNRRPHRLTALGLDLLINETSSRLERNVVAVVCIVRGDAHVAKKQWEDALVSFSQAFDLSQRLLHPPTEITALQKLGRCYRELEQANMAIGYVKQAVAVAKESGNQVLWYQANIFLANFLGGMDRRSDASTLWGEVLSLAQRYGDHEVERSTAKNLITVLMHSEQYYEVISSAESLDKVCQQSNAIRDRLFALEKLATAFIAVGEVRKALEAIDRMELLEDADVAAHDVANQLRAKALIAQREDHAAIDVITEWKLRATQQQNKSETMKATFALAEALANVSLSNAREEYFSVLQQCDALHRQLKHDELLAVEQRDLAMRAATWLIHSFYLNEEMMMIGAGSDDDGEGSHEEGFDGSAHLQPSDSVRVSAEGHAPPAASANTASDEEQVFEDGMQRTSSMRGEDDFVFDEETDQDELREPALADEDQLQGGNDDNGGGSGGHRLFSADDMTAGIIAEGCPHRCDGSSPTEAADDDEENGLQHHHHQDAASSILGLSECDDGHLIPCFNPQVAIEIMDAAMRLLAPHAVLPVYRSPKSVIDICLSSVPNATFVFYFLDYVSHGGGVPAYHYDVVIRPAGTPFFHATTVAVDTALADYHKQRKRLRPTTASQPSAGGGGQRSGASELAAESDGTDYLYATLRALHDVLWEPVAKVAATGNLLHQSDCVVVVPHPTLLHVPFSSLVSPKRKAIGQRACVVVSPSLPHFAFHAIGQCDDAQLQCPLRPGSFGSWLIPTPSQSDPTGAATERSTGDSEAMLLEAKKYFFVNSETSALPSLPTSATPGRSGSADRAAEGDEPQLSSSAFLWRNSTAGGSSSTASLATCMTEMNLTLVNGGTRKELVAALTSEWTRAVIVLSDSPPSVATSNANQQPSSASSSSQAAAASTCAAVFRMVDGDVHLSELTSVRPTCSENLELVIMTSDRSHQPSTSDLGAAARLCTTFNCKRVLRVDVSSSGGGSGGGAGITHQHVLMIKLYLQFVHVAFANGLRFPYAVALQAAQAEGIRQYVLPPHIWGALTLVGAP